MASFDSFSYDIISRMPEWYKEDALAFSVNKYTQDLIVEILEELLSATGVVQPINVWKSIPEEYDWYHHYEELDEYLTYTEGDEEVATPVCKFFTSSVMTAYVPNTKRKCHSKIKLKLNGGELESDDQIIEEFIITNGNQQIILHDIPKVCTIDILTESHQVLVDGKSDTYLIDGYFDKIQPTIKHSDFKVPYIDEDGETAYKPITIDDENKETKITFETSATVNFDLQIYLLKPTYTTEQNIRVATVSAFPLEWIRLYGYYCHEFNNQEGYQFLWEKTYTEESRTTYDRITKQYDCERFYIQVKFRGIGAVLEKGFPQEYGVSNLAFYPNEKLDKWGKIYGLQRRAYRTDITEDEEPFTFPRYYNYPIEQDYWYEERIVNEYRFNDQAVNSLFVKDSDRNNIASLQCIYPFMNDIWVYTETIDPDSDTTKELTDIKACPNGIEQINDSLGVDWENLPLMVTNHNNKPTIIKPYNEEIKKANSFDYMTKTLKVSFCVTREEHNVPSDINITGIELKFKALTNLHSNSLRLSDESYILLPFVSKINGEMVLEKVSISGEHKYWAREESYLTIGGKNNLFGLNEITRDQIFFDNDGKVEFELGFINESDFLEAQLIIEDMSLNIYYEVIPDEYDINMHLENKEVVLENEDPSTKLIINLTNESKKKILDKNLTVVVPPELKVSMLIDEEKKDFNNIEFELDVDESFSIDNILIEFSDEIKTGLYDILVICDDKILKEELTVRLKDRYGEE